MIILYQVPLDEKGALVRGRLKTQGRTWVEATAGEAGRTLRELFNGKNDPKAWKQEVPHKPGIFLDAEEYSNEDMAQLLDELAAFGVFFTYPVLAGPQQIDQPLGQVLLKEHDRKGFLSRVIYLQQLIDSTGKLQDFNYDEDKWSALKIAVADANDFIDAVVSTTENPQAEPVTTQELERVIANLQKSLNTLLN